MKGDAATWLIVGIALLLMVKYALVGLDLWDRTLHPGRLDLDPGPFAHPLFGLFSQASGAQNG